MTFWWLKTKRSKVRVSTVISPELLKRNRSQPEISLSAGAYL